MNPIKCQPSYYAIMINYVTWEKENKIFYSILFYIIIMNGKNDRSDFHWVIHDLYLFDRNSRLKKKYPYLNKNILIRWKPVYILKNSLLVGELHIVTDWSKVSISLSWKPRPISTLKIKDFLSRLSTNKVCELASSSLLANKTLMDLFPIQWTI